MLLDQFAILREVEPPQNLSPEDLFSAIEHLCKAGEILEECRIAMEEGIFDDALSHKFGEAWYQVNQCRVFTEQILFIEEVLIPVMGEINDAKCMLESVSSWSIGMTKPAFQSIMGCLFNAVSGLQPCVEELSSWVQGTRAEENQTGGEEEY
jgi:hypothetical protein